MGVRVAFFRALRGKKLVMGFERSDVGLVLTLS